MAWEMSPMRAPGPAAAIPAAQRALGRVDHRDALRGPRVAHDEADGGVGDDPAQGDGEVEGQQVAVGERVVVRQSVQHGVVDGRADVVAERPASEGRRVVDVAGHAPRPRRSWPGSTGRCPGGSCRPCCGSSASAGCAATRAPVSRAAGSSVGFRISIMRRPSRATNNYPGHIIPVLVSEPWSGCRSPPQRSNADSASAPCCVAPGESARCSTPRSTPGLTGDPPEDRVGPRRDPRLPDHRCDRRRPRPLPRRGVGRDQPA